MKIDRRRFLAFGIGGTVGTALTPLPWKLMDDISIWSQNWPWTPVPPKGEVSHVNSVCTLCPGKCGITVRKVGDRVVKIEGIKGHPVNDGGICLLGLSGPQFLYGPSRIRTPMKRAGERGEGRWEAISWKQAISEVTGRMADLRSKGQPHTVGCLLPEDRGSVPQLFSRLLTVFGSPNVMRAPSIEDSYELALYQTQGIIGRPGFDLEKTTYLLSFGSGYLQGWGSPVHMFKAHSRLLSKSARVVQVEPRLSISAAKADRWVAIKPGTEAALALGLCHVIIKESLYDKDFVGKHCQGFESWTDDQGQNQPGFKEMVLGNFTPATTADITGLSQADITELARTFAKASRPLAICGRGNGSVPGTLGEFMAVYALNALVGGVGRSGGILAVPEADYIQWPPPEMDETAARGMQQERLDGAGSGKYPLARYRTSYLAAAINGKKYPLQMLLVAGENPAYSLPGTAELKKALAAVPFLVSFSSFMDETAAMADLILPNHIYLERLEDIPPVFGLPRPLLQLCRPATSPQFNTRHTGDVIIEIARALGGGVAAAFPWKNYETCLKQTLGGHFARLEKDGYLIGKAPGRRFETASGKFEFVNAEYKTKPAFTPVEPQGDKGVFPLVLTGYDSMRLAGGAVADSPFMVKSVDDTVLKKGDILVEVNPHTAGKHSLAEGAAAVLVTPVGKARVRVHLSHQVPPGMVAMPRGLGHSAYDPFIGGKGVNFNDLIAPVPDPVSGLDAAWGIRASLTKV
jgi:anaerobic selenocysteine-containing dehydrogenase